jgi:hypothetical protein
VQRADEAGHRAAAGEQDASDSETPRPGTGRDAREPLAPQSVAGDLRTMVLADVLLWIATRHKSGTLYVRRGAVRKRVVFQDGVLRSASSNDPRETLGQLLLRDRLITEEQLGTTLLQQEKQGALLGILLVSDGLLSAEQLKRTLRAKSEQVVYDLFLWGEGGFHFQEGLLPKSVPMNLEMDTQATVQEGERRRKRWQRIRQSFAGPEVRFRAAADAQPPANPVERELFELAAAGKTLAEIALGTRRSEFETAEHLFSFVELNLLTLGRGRQEPETTGAFGAIQQLLARGRAALVDQRHDAAKEAFQDVLALDHLNRDAKQGLLALAEARQRQRSLRRLPPEVRPRLLVTAAQLERESLTAEERFLLSRIDGRWDVQSLLKLLPLAEEEASEMLFRLLERALIELQPAAGA